MSLSGRFITCITHRPPDFIIGGASRPYLRRWWLTPWRRWTSAAKRSPRAWVRFGGQALELLPNVYLHEFLRSDDDRALHDHPWLFNASLLLDGTYTEHTITAGGIHHRTVRGRGAFKFRMGPAPHRIELTHGRCWTLFITGPKAREWGFHCPVSGWVHWRQFTASDDAGAVGRGCGE